MSDVSDDERRRAEFIRIVDEMLLTYVTKTAVAVRMGISIATMSRITKHTTPVGNRMLARARLARDGVLVSSGHGVLRDRPPSRDVVDAEMRVV